MKRLFLSMLLMVIMAIGCTRKEGVPSEATGRGQDQETEDKIENLLSKMTLEEKIGQLNQYTSRWEMTGPAPGGDENAILKDIKEGRVGSMLNVVGARATYEAQKLAVENTRLAIPMIFGYDVVHGFKTMFPIPLAEAASWEPDLARKAAAVAAKESAAAGLHWTFAPMMDIGRDARWGRVMEGSGEDPHLGSLFAAARVKGFQGDDLASVETVAACAKHFAGYGFSESGKDYNTVDVSQYTLWNFILPPFKAAKEAGVATFMNSFNVMNGIPATGNAYLQREILKGAWNFDGVVVSDWGSIGEMINHGTAADKQEAARKAIQAGSDIDMEGSCYLTLKEQVETGLVDEKLVDDAVRRVLRLKFRLGLFDNPYLYSDTIREKSSILTPEHLELAREAARRSIVLLKNENGLLPLKKSGQKIVVIGELAESKDVPLGSWRASAIPHSAVSLLEGIRQAVEPNGSISFVKGPAYVVSQRSFATELKFNESDRSGMSEAVAAARRADVVVMALGEDCYQTGEGRSQTDIRMKGLQEELLQAVYAANRNVVVLLMNGRPLDISWMADNVPSILEVWHLGSQAGLAMADVLFGDYNPSGKLPVSFPRHVGQLPLYYNHFNTGRPGTEGGDAVFWSHYTDRPNSPLYPFGYGLSYTSFVYENLSLSSGKMSMEGELTVTVRVKNAGERAGEEVVQLYVRDLTASFVRPVKELKGFRKLMIAQGETAEIVFTLKAEDLGFYTPDGQFITEPGEFKLWVGPNSAEGLEASFTLE